MFFSADSSIDGFFDSKDENTNEKMLKNKDSTQDFIDKIMKKNKEKKDLTGKNLEVMQSKGVTGFTKKDLCAKECKCGYVEVIASEIICDCDDLGIDLEFGEDCFQTMSLSKLHQIFEAKMKKFSAKIQSVTVQINISNEELQECMKIKRKYQDAAFQSQSTVLTTCKIVHKLECEMTQIKAEVCGEYPNFDSSGNFCCKAAIKRIVELQRKLDKVRSRALLKDCFLSMCRAAKKRIVKENSVLKNDIKKLITVAKKYQVEIQQIQKAICNYEDPPTASSKPPKPPSTKPPPTKQPPTKPPLTKPSPTNPPLNKLPPTKPPSGEKPGAIGGGNNNGTESQKERRDSPDRGQRRSKGFNEPYNEYEKGKRNRGSKISIEKLDKDGNPRKSSKGYDVGKGNDVKRDSTDRDERRSKGGYEEYDKEKESRIHSRVSIQRSDKKDNSKISFFEQAFEKKDQPHNKESTRMQDPGSNRQILKTYGDNENDDKTEPEEDKIKNKASAEIYKEKVKVETRDRGVRAKEDSPKESKTEGYYNKDKEHKVDAEFPTEADKEKSLNRDHPTNLIVENNETNRNSVRDSDPLKNCEEKFRELKNQNKQLNNEKTDIENKYKQCVEELAKGRTENLKGFPENLTKNNTEGYHNENKTRQQDSERLNEAGKEKYQNRTAPNSLNRDENQDAFPEKTNVRDSDPLKNCEKKLRELENQNEQLDNEKAESDNKNKLCQEKLAKCIADYQNCISGNLDAQHLVDQIASLQAQNSTLQNQINDCNSKLNLKEIENETLNEQNLICQKDLRKCEEALRQRPLDCLQYIQKIGNLETQIVTLTDQNRSNLLNFEGCKNKLEACENDLAKCKAELLKPLPEISEELARPVETTECKEWINLSTKLKGLLGEYRAKVLRHVFMLKMLEKERDELKTENEDSIKKLKKSEDSLKQLLTDYKGPPLQAQIDLLMKEVEKHKVLIKKYEDANLYLIEQKEEALNEVKKGQDNIRKLEEEIKLAHSSGDRYLAQQLSTFRNENSKLLDELTNHKTEVDKLTKQLKSCNENLENRNLNLEKCRSDLAAAIRLGGSDRGTLEGDRISRNIDHIVREGSTTSRGDRIIHGDDTSLKSDHVGPDRSKASVNGASKIINEYNASSGSRDQFDKKDTYNTINPKTGEVEVRDGKDGNGEIFNTNSSPSAIKMQIKKHASQIRQMKKMYRPLQDEIRKIIASLHFRPGSEHIQNELKRIYKAIDRMKKKMDKVSDDECTCGSPKCAEGCDPILHKICVQITIRGIASLDCKQLVYLHCSVYRAGVDYNRMSRKNRAGHRSNLTTFISHIRNKTFVENSCSQASSLRLHLLENEVDKTKDLLNDLRRYSRKK